MAGRHHRARDLAQQLIGFLPDSARTDFEHDAATAAIVGRHHPDVRIISLPSTSDWESDDCSCDGFYENTLSTPTIVYRATVSDERIRFTILHELAHHLLQHEAADLLDELDAAAGHRGDVQGLEELVCHAFAGRLLVPDALIDRIVTQPVLPRELVGLHEGSNGSWEACAVRLAECLNGAGAVIIMRDDNAISFCAPSAAGDLRWWPRGAGVKPNGPLARALSVERQRAQDEEYRWQLSDPAIFYCDTQRVHAGLAIAILAEHPTAQPTFAPPGTRQPSEPDTDRWCEACNGLLAGDWCETCHTKRCIDCHRCRCNRVRTNPLCPACGLLKPRNRGKEICTDCEADGL